MTWEEYEKEYGIEVTHIPSHIKIYDTISDNKWYSDTNGSSYGASCERCDGLTYEHNDLLSFTPIRVGSLLHCICNDDLYNVDKTYQSWVLDNLTSRI